MPEGGLQQQLRLALSWREKALRLEKEALTPQGKRMLDVEQQRFEGESLQNHVFAAETHLQQLRKQLAQRLETLGADLQRSLKRQESLTADCAAGAISAEEANSQNRALIRRITVAREQIRQFNALMHADDAAQLGGYINLPLEQYAAEFDAGASRGSTFWRENRITLLITFFVLIVAIGGIAAYKLGGREVSFAMLAPPSPGAPLFIDCRNGTLHRITWQVPWAPGQEDPPSDWYGVNLLVRERDDKTFKAFSPATPVWWMEGTYTDFLEPLQVEPGLTARVSLDLPTLRQVLPTLEGLQVQCTRGGREVALFILDPVP